ncbi:MAG: phosphoribosylformylglycinamidine synthase subunit PurL [Planctomycetes bacterium]|nr:phosphoribosylformylglycinamidine synthase subunit PurL [Planctomycetota bacterium]
MGDRLVVEVSRLSSDEEDLRLRLPAGVAGLRGASVYELSPVTLEAAERLARELLCDPALDQASIGPEGAPAPRDNESVLTVMRRDGVMDPVALSTSEAAQRLGIPLERVRTGLRIYARGEGSRPSTDALESLARQLSNPVVDRVLFGSEALPEPGASGGSPVLRSEVPLAGLDAEALVALSRAWTLALDAVEMQAVQAHYQEQGRAPSALELETIAQTWSEHCKHKTLTGPTEFVERSSDGQVVASRRYENLLKETIFASTTELDDPRCLSVFSDNAGVIKFDETQGVAIKVETHNHPSAIEPYGGAGTGIGGVIRDILGTGLGARPIANIDVFCVGDLRATQHPTGTIHPRELLAGVVGGVRDYGNRMGIPTVAGALVSDPRYVGNPLVYAGTIGLIPNEFVHKAPRPGDWVIAMGGRTGRDGIHGATFSSESLTAESETQSGGAVQIGNPIEEKKVADVLLEVRDRGWMSALTDCGAGGFSSAVGEMAEGLGADVDLAVAPLKYPGLAPWEVWISEAQERMVLAVPPEHGLATLELCAAEDVEAVKLGTFADSGRLVIRWGETVVGDLDIHFLHDGLPKQERTASWTRPEPRAISLANEDLGQLLRRILAHPSVCSKEWIVRQYDHEVQGASVLKSLVGVASRGPGDGVALAPIPGEQRGVLIGLGIQVGHGDLDPYRMSLSSIEEALRNVVAIGGDPTACAILDNFSWGNCRRPEQLGAIVLAAEACRDAALAYKTPFVSGKDSLNNEYQLDDGTAVSIPHTLLITAVAVTDDVTRLVSADLKGAGHPLYLVGETRAELGGSLAAIVLGLAGGEVPAVDLATSPGALATVHAAIRTGGVLACHDLSEGGLAVAAAESAFAGEIGATIYLDRVPQSGGLDPATLLFSESPTRFLLEVDPAQADAVEAALAGIPHARVGQTEATPELKFAGAELSAPLGDLLEVWRRPLFDLYGD